MNAKQKKKKMDELLKFHNQLVECKKVFDAVTMIVDSEQIDLDECVVNRMLEAVEELRKSLNWLVSSLACSA